MKIHRFIGDFDFKSPTLDILDENIVHQITRVLKLKNGEKIILGDGNRNEIEGEITGIEKNHIKVKVNKKYKNTNESDKHVRLYCAILKKENFELVVQKASEIGVSEIIPMITDRTIKTSLKYERLQSIAHEASELSGRGIVPTIREATSYKIAMLEENKTKIFFDISGETFDDKKTLNSKNISIYIGPEGGWSEEEHDLAKENSCIEVSLGKLTLRGETAAIIASYLALK
jgi:16S rRNA (uracil1498-N3)-methyltransferase